MIIPESQFQKFLQKLDFPENYLSIEVNLRDERELRDLQTKILNEYKKYVESIEILDYYDEQKYSYMSDFLRTLQELNIA